MPEIPAIAQVLGSATVMLGSPPTHTSLARLEKSSPPTTNYAAFASSFTISSSCSLRLGDSVNAPTTKDLWMPLLQRLNALLLRCEEFELSEVMARNPPLYMKHGDVCEIEIEGIGILRNTAEDE